MIQVVCDPGSRYTKLAATRPERFAPVFLLAPSHEADDLGSLSKRVASMLRPGFFEPIELWIVGDGWVPKRTRARSVLLGTALAKAVAPMGESALVADCGGLRTRVFDVAAGALRRTLENERCTSGGGRFVETMSAALAVELEQIDSCIAKSSSPCRVSSPCMVFAESEMISQVNSGAPKEDVLAGVVAHAVEKVATLVAKADPAGRPLLLSGGLARLAAFRSGLSAALPSVPLVEVGGDPLYLNCVAGLAMVCQAPAEAMRQLGWPTQGERHVG